MSGRKVALARVLRRVATPAERLAWELLRNRRCFGLKFRRQVVIGAFIVDFYCPALSLVIEIDGGIHDDPLVRLLDRGRDEILEELKLRVVHIRNEAIEGGAIQSAVAEILREHQQTPRSLPSPFRERAEERSDGG